MKKASRFLALALACIFLSLGSLADEAAQVIFALRLADSASSVSTLLVAGLVGGIFAGPITPRLLSFLGPLKTISLVFLVESLLIGLASIAKDFATYILVAAALGCMGSLLWSAIIVAIPAFASSDRNIDLINRVVQSVRYLGYAGGPAVGGFLYAMTDESHGMLALSLLILLAAPIIIFSFRILSIRLDRPNRKEQPNERKGLDFTGLARTSGVLRAVCPLIVTIILTSALNVLLIIRVRNELHLGPEIYGAIVSSISVGLIIGPLLLSGLFGRLGDAIGASAAATIIGLGIILLATANVVWSIMLSALLIGAANGIQNTLMSSFMMKAIDKDHCFNQIPAYFFSLQCAVCVGFIAARFIGNRVVSDALLAIGIASMIAGSVGVIINIFYRTDNITKGARS
ncbi:MFS transporter [Verminephrobacter aporrectodeae subsp. tuberculatae]|uniref:MFS transporter n=1 Tax=Verminephrobacter aporrectodeae TaxID=1110389 RepID=UPI0022385B24|nr:MFS transporter [Verminephrobacter aporrectodeae]MCW5258404.1 MFS transporter [Verminephrobacter aporrectodeae subsp. tuberculatae]